MNEYTFVITISKEAKTEDEAWEIAREEIIDDPGYYLETVHVLEGAGEEE